MQLIYVQIYVNLDIVDPIDFQVGGGQLHIDSFAREEVRCVSLIVMALAHSTFDGKCISFHFLYYVDSLLTMTWLIRWSAVFL